MKKVFILLLGAGVLFSCTNFGKKVTESEEYQKLQAERDSLQAVLKTSDTETQEMMAVIGEVEANFDKIREAEKYISTQSAQSGEMNQDTKKRVNDNFQMIQEILRRNKAQLAELNKKYASSNKQVASLQATIDRLNKEMQESSARLVVLQGELSKRDATIAQLSSDISELAQHAEAQSSTIKEQDKSLHTAYYVFGTANELKEQKILSGGFLKSTKVMQDTFNKDYFLQIDIREVTEIPLYTTKAKLWSTHPEGTYEFVKGVNQVVVSITDGTTANNLVYAGNHKSYANIGASDGEMDNFNSSSAATNLQTLLTKQTTAITTFSNCDHYFTVERIRDEDASFSQSNPVMNTGDLITVYIATTSWRRRATRSGRRRRTTRPAPP